MVFREAIEDEQVARDIQLMSARDPIFWVNTFCWGFDPRLPEPIEPFILFDVQEEALVELIGATGIMGGTFAHDMALPKSRDMGATLTCIFADLWMWCFVALSTFLWVSRKEELVDKPDDPKTLFWKARHTLKRLPGFMRPKHVDQRMHLLNVGNSSTIDGESTTGDVGRGDRRTGILLDEFAAVEDGLRVLSATADATGRRVLNSTHQGPGTAFFKTIKKGIATVEMWWYKHPRKAAGLYQAKDGQLTILDEDYQFPFDYPFILDGKLRSPWYDAEEERRSSRLEMAQEVDGDVYASGSPFFEPEVLARVKAEDVKEPWAVGELSFDAATLAPKKFIPMRKGRLLLWMHLDHNGKPFLDRQYAMGADISAGSDASPSCCSVLDGLTFEKVAEFCTINVSPHEFAELCVVLARWFSGDNSAALLNWEANGPGQQFGSVVVKNYSHVFYRASDTSRRIKQSNEPGWFSTREGKRTVLGDYRRALNSKLFINRSAQAIEECYLYMYQDNGAVDFVGGNMEDPTGAGENHGDRVIADAVANQALSRIRVVKSLAETEQKGNSLGRRRERRRLAKVQEEKW